MRQNFEEVKKDFENTKRKYDELRERERKELAKYLKEHIEKGRQELGLTVVSAGGAGKGREDYTSGSRIKEYNLRNWKWVELKWKNAYSSFGCVVSLNMHEVDPKSANVHVLCDRIGLYIEYKIGETYYSTEIYTDVELPLGDDDYESIGGLILNQFKIFRYLAK